jgi:hypothetical protein
MFEPRGVVPTLMPSALSETGALLTCTPSTAILLSLTSWWDKMVSSQPLLLALALPSLPCPPAHGRCPAPAPHGCSARWTCSGLHMGCVIHLHHHNPRASLGTGRPWYSPWVGRGWHTCGRQVAGTALPPAPVGPVTPLCYHILIHLRQSIN